MLHDRVSALARGQYLRAAALSAPDLAALPRSDRRRCEDGALDVTANFLVVRTMQDGAMTLFAAGRYIDRVVRGGAGWLFARKDVVLDSRQIDTLLAIPL